MIIIAARGHLHDRGHAHVLRLELHQDPSDAGIVRRGLERVGAAVEVQLGVAEDLTLPYQIQGTLNKKKKRSVRSSEHRYTAAVTSMNENQKLLLNTHQLLNISRNFCIPTSVYKRSLQIEREVRHSRQRRWVPQAKISTRVDTREKQSADFFPRKNSGHAM